MLRIEEILERSEERGFEEVLDKAEDDDDEDGSVGCSVDGKGSGLLDDGAAGILLVATEV